MRLPLPFFFAGIASIVGAAVACLLGSNGPICEKEQESIMVTQFICANCLPRLALVFALACLALPESQAAPVTLRFEATIGPSRSGAVPISLPFSFVEGYPVRGTLAYESLDVAPTVALTETLQPFALTFEIGGHSFGVSS